MVSFEQTFLGKGDLGPMQPHLLPPVTDMYRALETRDTSYDGMFYLAVRTTGIFCRPSCPARKPLRQNIEFYATPREALVAGYRPCKRCHPLEADGSLPDWADALIHEIEADPSQRLTDADLRARHLEPATVRRFFLKRYGMTFHAYARSRRLGQAFTAIKNGGGIDEAVFNAGYESFSGFREAFGRTFGQPPGQSRATGDPLVVSWVESQLGPLVVAATNEAVCLLEFSDRRMLEAQFITLQKRFKQGLIPGTNDHLEQLRDELRRYFAGELRQFTVPLSYPGTPFQERVWSELLTVPYGETRTYAELAAMVGVPNGQRAVGQANGLNRIAIVIPCHRVINAHGALGGYGGGVWRKQLLLSLERGEITLTDNHSNAAD